jgi:hypothetical protein
VPVDGLLYISRVDKTPTKNKTVNKYLITFSDGAQASTINPQLSGLAEQCCQELCAVTYESKPSKYGPDLVALKREPARVVAAVEVAPMITSDEIPF